MKYFFQNKSLFNNLKPNNQPIIQSHNIPTFFTLYTKKYSNKSSTNNTDKTYNNKTNTPKYPNTKPQQIFRNKDFLFKNQLKEKQDLQQQKRNKINDIDTNLVYTQDNKDNTINNTNTNTNTDNNLYNNNYTNNLPVSNNAISKLNNNLNKPLQEIPNIIIPQKSPLEILNQPVSLIYSYSSIQLHEALSAIKLEEKNLGKIISVFSYIVKKADFTHIESEEIEKALIFVLDNISSVKSTSFKVNILNSISKIKKLNSFVFKERIYNTVNVLYNELKSMNSPNTNTNNTYTNNRLISNYIYSLYSLQTMKGLTNNEYSFDSLFFNMEEVIITSLNKEIMDASNKNNNIRNELNVQSYSNIILAYSKSQNGSVEFYRILADMSLEYFNNINTNQNRRTQELANIVYCYSNNINCNEKILYLLKEPILQNIHKAKPKEIVCILRAYHRKDLIFLDEFSDLLNLIRSQVISKKDFCNPKDIAYIYSILADKYYEDINHEIEDLNRGDKDKVMGNISNDNDSNTHNIIQSSNPNNHNQIKAIKFFDVLHYQISNLLFSFEANEMSVLFEKIHILQKIDNDLYNQVKEATIKNLVYTNKIKPYDLEKIYYSIKGVPFSGKYNIFKEEIVQAMRKKKHYL